MKDQNNYFSQSPQSVIRKQLKLYKKQKSKKSGSEIAPWQQYINQMGKTSFPISSQKHVKNIKNLKRQSLSKNTNSINLTLKIITQIEKTSLNKINQKNQKIYRPTKKLLEISQQVIDDQKNVNFFIKTLYQSKNEFDNKNKNKNVVKYKKYGYQAIKNIKNTEINQNLSGTNNTEQIKNKIIYCVWLSKFTPKEIFSNKKGKESQNKIYFYKKKIFIPKNSSKINFYLHVRPQFLLELQQNL